jgi:hypothetical protein
MGTLGLRRHRRELWHRQGDGDGIGIDWSNRCDDQQASGLRVVSKPA